MASRAVQRTFKRAAVAVTAGSLVVAVASVALPLSASAEVEVDATGTASCAALNAPIYQTINPKNNVSLVTPSAGEAEKSEAAGLTEDNGVAFTASLKPGPGLVPINRLYRTFPQDFVESASPEEWSSAFLIFKYVDQGTRFYAATEPASCLVAVHRFVRGSRHRLAADQRERTDLVQDGWRDEGIFFYARPASASAASATPNPPAQTPPVTPDPPAQNPPAPNPPAGGGTGTFKFAVIPDTQNEVYNSSDPRMKSRTNWLVQEKPRFVIQTGDLVSYDSPDHAQYKIAAEAFDVLENANIPYAIAIGNHDTQATGADGGPRDPANTRALARDTSTFNQFFTAKDYGGVAGAYADGKVDNVYTTYEAGGLKWMVLTLEFCARPAVVEWAKKVVAEHPQHNVIINTHSYLNGSGGLDSSNQGYADTSGLKLHEQLSSQYPNVKMTFSGHVGYANKATIQVGKDGNKIHSWLTTFHDTTNNPTRMLEVDASAGTIKTWIYSPNTNKTWSEYSETVTGLTFVR